MRESPRNTLHVRSPAVPVRTDVVR
jgi:hypothetical protein